MLLPRCYRILRAEVTHVTTFWQGWRYGCTDVMETQLARVIAHAGSGRKQGPGPAPRSGCVRRASMTSPTRLRSLSRRAGVKRRCTVQRAAIPGCRWSRAKPDISPENVTRGHQVTDRVRPQGYRTAPTSPQRLQRPTSRPLSRCHTPYAQGRLTPSRSPAAVGSRAGNQSPNCDNRRPGRR